MLSGCFAFLFSTCIGFFPWGDYDAYVIWGSFAYSVFLPSYLILGGFFFIINRDKSFIFLLYLLYTSLYSIPRIMRFGNSDDIAARWIGFIIGFLGLFWFCFILITSFKLDDGIQGARSSDTKSSEQPSRETSEPKEAVIKLKDE